MRKNFYASEDSSEVALKAGVCKLSAEMVSLGVSQAWLVCESKSNVSGMIANVIGEGAAKALTQGKTVQVSGSGTIALKTSAALPLSAKGVAILACFPSVKLLDKLDGLRDAAVLIVIPWNNSELARWVKTYGPEDVLSRTNPVAVTVSNPVVIHALESISRAINFSTGVVDPRDKDSVIDAFRILRNAKEDINADEVRAWLVRKGMKPEHANKIAEIAADPGRFRKSSSTSRWRSDILEQWRKG